MKTHFGRSSALALMALLPLLALAEAPDDLADPPFSTGYFMQMAMHFARFFFDGSAPTQTCGDGPGFRYCTYAPPDGVEEDPEAVTYFLHFAGGSEKTFSEVPISRVYYAKFRARRAKAPRVISISYGKYWILLDKPGPKQPRAMYEHFTQTAMPWLEARLPAPPTRRYVWGMSQGGLNGALLLFKNPAQWSGAVLACPAFLSVSVFADAASIEEYARRTRANLGLVHWGANLLKSKVADESEWRREEPLGRAAAPNAPTLPPVLVDANRDDEFGFIDASRKFVSDLRGRGTNASLNESSGAHCAVDARGDADFLVNLAARLPQP